MDPRIEEILMARAMQDNASVPTTGEAFTGGGALGTAAGALAGRGIKGRMAGGLLGAILGGGLGVGTRQMMINNSPAASILAKAQTQGLNEDDRELLARILSDTYSEMGLR